jgi:hypothetical protein
MAGQVFGKIFTKEEADNQFGKVLKSNEIGTTALADLCKKSADVLMFSLREDGIVILGNGRVPLYPDEKLVIPAEEIFHVFSISVIKELIAAGGNGKTFIEKRQRHLTITNGNTTLEESSDCPPYC